MYALQIYQLPVSSQIQSWTGFRQDWYFAGYLIQFIKAFHFENRFSFWKIILNKFSFKIFQKRIENLFKMKKYFHYWRLSELKKIFQNPATVHQSLSGLPFQLSSSSLTFLWYIIRMLNAVVQLKNKTSLSIAPYCWLYFYTR